MAPITKGMSCVLFVQARPVCGPTAIRIEGTKDPAARLNALSDDNAVETFLAGVIETTEPAAAEAHLAEMFRPFHLRGKWFSATNELMGYIQLNAQQVLVQKLSELRTHSHPDNTMTIEQIAEHLHVSTRTIRRMVDDGTIPHLRAGRQLRFMPGDVVASLRK